MKPIINATVAVAGALCAASVFAAPGAGCDSVVSAGSQAPANQFAKSLAVSAAYRVSDVTREGGSVRWEWAHRACGAPNMGVYIRDLYLPDGWSLTMTAEGGETQALKPNARGGVQAWPMPGELIALIAVGPSATAGEVQIDSLELSVGIPGRDDIAPPMAKNGSFTPQAVDPEEFVNATCFTPNNMLAQQVSQATASVVVGGGVACTGALVNHSSSATRPFIITAAHCVDPQSLDARQFAEDGRVTARFEVTDACGETASSVFGSGRPSITSIATAYIEYNAMGTPGRQNDYWIVEMDDYPEREGTIRMLGYDLNRAAIGSEAMMIHHGRVRTQQFAEGFVEDYQATFGSSDTPDADLWRANARYRVRYTTGCSRVGSSGSSLVNDSGRVIGTLFGGSVGEAGCSAGISALDDSADSPALRSIFVADSMNGAVAPMPRATPAPTATPTVTPPPTAAGASPSSGGGGSGLGMLALLLGAGLGRRTKRGE